MSTTKKHRYWPATCHKKWLSLIGRRTSQPTNLDWLAWIPAGLGAAVAIASSIEEFFHDGDHWQNYRSSVELLRSEGWQYINLGGPYRRFEDHRNAFTKFSERVEEIIQLDVQTYISDIVGEREREGKRPGGGRAAAATSATSGDPS